MYNFPAHILAILHDAGWYEGRKIDTTKFVKCFEEEGYALLPNAIDFLSEFGDLKIWRPLPSGIMIRFDTSIIKSHILMSGSIGVTTDVPYSDSWSLGEVVAPIGECEESYEYVVIGTSGKVFLIDDMGAYLLGDSVERALIELLTISDTNLNLFVAYPVEPEERVLRDSLN